MLTCNHLREYALAGVSVVLDVHEPRSPLSIVDFGIFSNPVTCDDRYTNESGVCRCMLCSIRFGRWCLIRT